MLKPKVMDAYEMVVRSARGQNPGRSLRYEVRTILNDKCGARYADLPSALEMGKLLVNMGYPSVLVLDMQAAPGQPQVWIWEAGGPGAGAWRAQARKQSTHASSSTMD